MWSYIITDSLFHTNYNLGFPETSSDVLLNLTHWQYWWWYWFTLLMCLYFFFFIRLIRHRTLKFSPKIVTSYRAHGKWGDFIIALLPVSWCINILSNSNFILRLLEWQTEANLLTIRIRGRQWYWVYKIELQSLLEINNITKNIGHNYWVVWNNSNNTHTDTYINVLRARWNDDFYSNYLTNTLQFDTEDSLKNLWHFNNSLKKSYHFNLPKKNSFVFKTYTTDYIWNSVDLSFFLEQSIDTNYTNSLNLIEVTQNWPNIQLQPKNEKLFFTKQYNDVIFENSYKELYSFFLKEATRYDIFFNEMEIKKINLFFFYLNWVLYEDNSDLFYTSYIFLNNKNALKNLERFNLNTINPKLGSSIKNDLTTFYDLFFFKKIKPFFKKNFKNNDCVTNNNLDLLDITNTSFFLEDPVLEYSLNWLYADLTNNTNYNNYGFNEFDFLKNIYTPLNSFSLDKSLLLKDFFLNDFSVNTRTNIFAKFEPLKIYWFNNTLFSEFNQFNNNLVTEHDLCENTYLVIIQKRLDNKETPLNKSIYNPQKKTKNYYVDDTEERKIDVALAYSWFQNFDYFEILDNDTIVYDEEIKNEHGVVVLKFKRYFEIWWKDHMPEHGGRTKAIKELLLEKLSYAREIEKQQWDAAVKANLDPLKEVKFLFTKEPLYYDAVTRKTLRTRFSKNTQQPNIYARRLLRTRRLLVLPTNINITLITNSFDVVHSWYIPGLGVKMDCIPGRSTHHTLHIDHAGFYYGQCAEICGRFHHHMPIRICALPFEHFLVWWYHYGLPYFLAGEGEKRDSFIKNSIRSLNW